ncbi:MAG: Flagellar hook-length control protein FliK [Acidobacteria bacterium]|nr:Flagellar hook-length control protein FliK [Acidobacteriota bacterium]
MGDLRISSVVLFWAVTSLTGCFSPEVTNGGLQCADGGVCPSGFHCAVDNRCWKLGQEPSGVIGEDLAVSANDDLGETAPDMTAPLSAGAPCSASSQCESGFCVDGVCCQSACDGSCQSCGLAGSLGKCLNVPAGSVPASGHPSCGPDPQSGCMRDGTCDGAGGCHLWDKVVCKAGSCDATTNQATAASKCDGKGVCITPNAVTCAPYVCLPDNTACYPSCSGTSTGCKAPNVCNAGSCGPKANGTPCAANGECATNHCSPDGYCCDTACTGKCEACDVGINRGVCTAITSGQPEQSHGGNCTGFGTNSCGGGCAAGVRATCSYPGDGNVANVVCAATNCKDATTQYNSAQCNGTGACNTQSTTACGAYVCSNNACRGTCSGTDDTNCAPGNYCTGSACAAAVANGQACSRGRQCTSGYCADGVCCNMPCTGQCSRCDATPGTCTPTANNAVPVNGRAACGTDSTCNGSCDGSGSCGHYPTISCRNAQCIDAHKGVDSATCDGAGHCPAPVVSDCGTGWCCPGPFCINFNMQCP